MQLSVSLDYSVMQHYIDSRMYVKGHFERPPYTSSSMRSAYHVRELEAYRLKQLRQPMDIMLSHDWPDGIAYHGDTAQLLKCKPFLKAEVHFLPAQPSIDLKGDLIH